ncbi:hypothetical protein B296_00026721 [Ensete ventricosum]|uniref:Uncharacterized protein n=1 Tax=Ensete ventricosum TaxID=4639 RepID=A0A426YKQ3_ENSVE|nr:hypothetical protein B296_00026721 [Ensete ventricosum]
MGIDPCTHKAKSDALVSADGHSKSAANLSHMAQWESARLEAEARLVRESKLRAASNSTILQQHQEQPQHQMGSSSSSSSTTALPPALLASKPGAHPGPPPCLDVLRAWHGVWPAKPALERVDLESPTSTLSFAAAGVGLVDGNAAAVRHQGGENLEPESAEWKCLAKDRMDSFAGFSVDAFGGEAPWLPEPYTSQEGCAWGQFGSGLTGLLLGDSGRTHGVLGKEKEVSKALLLLLLAPPSSHDLLQQEAVKMVEAGLSFCTITITGGFSTTAE